MGKIPQLARNIWLREIIRCKFTAGDEKKISGIVHEALTTERRWSNVKCFGYYIDFPECSWRTAEQPLAFVLKQRLGEWVSIYPNAKREAQKMSPFLF